MKSSDGTFTTGELKNASIILPGYLNTGSVNANGTFVIGNSTIDIVPESNVAIFPPQTIGYGKNLATITINGRTYDLKVTEANGFEYVPGVAYTLTADLKKASVLMSALVTPWTEETHVYCFYPVATMRLPIRIMNAYRFHSVQRPRPYQ